LFSIEASNTDSVDILLGIPSRNESKTISQVVRTIDQGLSTFFPHQSAIIVNADNSSEDGTAQVFLDTPTQVSKVVIDTGNQPSGKGVNVLTILRYAAERRARLVCLFDADVTSVRPDWVYHLALPALQTDTPILVTPIYTRNRFEGNTTNHIVYPCLYALFGVHIQQPIAGEFALNDALVQEVLKWPVAESTLQYGIDVFLTANVLAHNFQIQQVRLTSKLHNPGFPKILHMSQQVLDTLLRIIATSCLDKTVTFRTDNSSTQLGRASVDKYSQNPNDNLVAFVYNRVTEYLYMHQEQLQKAFPSLPTEFLADIPSDRPALESPLCTTLYTDLWCTLLADALVGLTPSTFYTVRDGLVALYLCRVFTYWQTIAEYTPSEIDALLYNQAASLGHVLSNHHALIPHMMWRDLPSSLNPGPWSETTNTF
jgi:glucosylglycerate synthase